MQALLKLYPYLKPYRLKIIVVIILGAVMSILQGLVAPLTTILFNDVFGTAQTGVTGQMKAINDYLVAHLGHEKEKLVVAIPLTFVALYFLTGIVRYYHFYIVRVIGEKLSIDLRKDLQAKYLDLNISYHQKFASGGMMNKILNDVQYIQQGIYLYADFVREPILTLLLFLNLLLLDPTLTFYTIISAPIFYIAIKQTTRGLKKYGLLSQLSLDTLTSTLKETFDGVKIIQSFGLEQKVKDKFSAESEEFLRARKKIVIHEEIAGPLSEFLGATLFSALCIYVGKGILNGTSSPGVVVGFLMALGLMQKPVKKLQEAIIRVQQIAVCTERIFEVLDSTEKVTEIPNPKIFPKNFQTINFKDLHFSYDSEVTLKDVNFIVKRGEIVAIVGESGSGKSTVMNLLERFFDPARGNIIVDNTPIKDMAVADLRSHIALVTQDVFLFDDTIEANIHAGNLKKDPRFVREAARMANADDFIQKLKDGYHYKVGERGQKLSGGEKQRISIARALFRDAPILILDEATSALDSVSEIEVQKGIEQLMKGRTCFVIAHRLSTIRHAHRILVFQKGTIVETGSHEELLEKRGAYFRFYQIQTEGQLT
jgi:ATP-binding cassette, subfamily B, bacterial MsbA